jgi:hypothetical protein
MGLQKQERWQNDVLNGLKKNGIFITHLDDLTQFGVSG